MDQFGHGNEKPFDKVYCAMEKLPIGGSIPA